MHYPGALIHGDVIRDHAQNCAIEKWVSKSCALEFSSGKVRELARCGQSRFTDKLTRQPLGDDVHLIARFERNVLFLRMERHSHRSRQCPWRCGPDRSEEHTSELQSRLHLVCRLLL